MCLGVLLAGEAHRLGQVAGADEEDVDPRNLDQLRQVVDRFDLFQHQADQRLAVGAWAPPPFERNETLQRRFVSHHPAAQPSL